MQPENKKYWKLFWFTDNHSTKMMWYMRTLIGKGDLGQYIEKMMVMAGVDGYFTNHSLRHTTATRLFDKDKDEQLIQEQTGHNCGAVVITKGLICI